MSTKRKLETPVKSKSITSFFKSTGEPQTKKRALEIKPGLAASQTSIRPKFNKEQWVNKLSPENKELLELEISTLHDSWLAVLHEELTKPYFLALKKFLREEKARGQQVFPPDEDIYSWSRMTPLDTVKVVILGQDPYHNVNQAHGLAFSVNPPTPPPPSLRNMYKALKLDYSDFEAPRTGLLTAWAEQGVLMLNTVLTVRAHNANSHAKRGWEQFTERALAAVVKSRPSGVCFLAWGNPAYQRVTKINPDLKVHLILRSVHPSPLSASRGFFDGHHFKKSNEWLLERYGSEGLVNWSLVEGNVLKDIEKMKKTSDTKENQEDDDGSKEKDNVEH